MLSKHIAAFLLLVALPCRAEDVFFGAVVSGGQVVGEPKGRYVDVAGYGGLALWLILGAETKEFSGKNLNAVYSGMGFTSLLQAHIGLSNHGGIYRVKSEIAPFALYHGGVYSDSRDPLASLKRLSFSVIYENTFEDKGLSNVTIGMGYAFN